MALIVEDGTGKPDAESYISVSDADAYFSNRGNATWAALDTTQKEQALRSATDYMLQAFRMRWAGMRVTETQALDWPRRYVPNRDVPNLYGPYVTYYAFDTVPVAVGYACAELAVRASATPLSPDLTAQVKQETVGPISVTYADGARQVPEYKAVDAMLAPFLKGMGAVPVVRA
jgi:hypothetical protein